MSKCFDCGKEHLKSKGGMGYCGNCGKWTSKRIDSDMSALKTTYSLEQVLQILRNVGTDTKCGACMEIPAVQFQNMSIVLELYLVLSIQHVTS